MRFDATKFTVTKVCFCQLAGKEYFVQDQRSTYRIVVTLTIYPPENTEKASLSD